MTLSKGEKLIITMLADIHEHLNIEDSVDPAFIRKHVDSDFWAIEREYPGIFGGGERDEADISFVQDALDMWRIVEDSYAQLPPEDQEKVRNAEGAHGRAPKFGGFDGHTEYPSIARTLVEDLDSWTEFQGREFDSHTPDTEMHERMIDAYKSVRGKGFGGYLSVDDLITVVDARIHPEYR
jgi:uncharacterized protein YfbU (UPF0304 family)